MEVLYRGSRIWIRIKSISLHLFTSCLPSLGDFHKILLYKRNIDTFVQVFTQVREENYRKIKAFSVFVLRVYMLAFDLSSSVFTYKVHNPPPPCFEMERSTWGVSSGLPPSCQLKEGGIQH